MKPLALFLKIGILCVLITSVSACAPLVEPSPTQDENASSTQVAQTVEARLTEVWSAATATSSPTATPEIPTATNTALPTSTPLPTNTSLPTNTPLPTATVTPVPLPCLAAEFVKDLTAPNGVEFPGNSQFTKVWQIRNAGSCTWTKAYQVVFESGKQLNGKATNLPKKVAPGETVEISIPMKAPGSKGTYEGFWMLKSDQGKKFGIGPKHDQPINVKIKVPGVNASQPYDFASEFCSAAWRDSNGKFYCHGNPSVYKNTVRYATLFKMENGKQEDEPVVLVNINTGETIKARYPAMTIQAGDRFVSRVGCVSGNTTCRVQIILRYEIISTGEKVVLSKHVERYDQNSKLLEFDLSSLAGKEVVFVLEMNARSDSGINQIFWLVPSIRNP